jgi:hypothetical protein
MGCGASKNSVADANGASNNAASDKVPSTPNAKAVNVFSVLEMDALSPDGSPPVKSQFRSTVRDAESNTSAGGVRES